MKSDFIAPIREGLVNFLGRLAVYEPFAETEPETFSQMLVTAKYFGIKPSEIAKIAQCTKQSVLNWTKGDSVPPQFGYRRVVRDAVIKLVQQRLAAL